MNRQLRIGVIGVGALGRHHARLLSEMEDVKLVGVADPNEQQGRAVAEATGCRWVEDYCELLDRVDAVTVVVPTSLHRRVAEECLSRGLPVLVEKPLAANLEDGQALCSLAADQAVPLQVGHIERFNPAFRALASKAATPKYIKAERFSPYAFRSMDISVVMDVMIHDIDLTAALVRSPVRRVDAFGICIMGGLPDIVQARLTFENGCIADLTANRVSPDFKRQMQVWSEAGCFTADFNEQSLSSHTPQPLLLGGVLPCELAQEPGADIEQLKQDLFAEFIKPATSKLAKRNALQDELTSFIECIQNGGTPIVDGYDGLTALELATQIEEAVNTHAWDGNRTGRIGPYAHPIFDQQTAAA